MSRQPAAPISIASASTPPPQGVGPALPASPATVALPATPASIVPLGSPTMPIAPHPAVGAPVETENRALLRWMFRFLWPVRWKAFIACTYLAVLIAAEVETTRYVGEAVNEIKALHLSNAAAGLRLRAWVTGGEPQAAGLRSAVLALSMLAIAMTVLRYLKEVANMKMSMHMVFYLREAVYDKIQRVGFGLHDAMSSGQLINRSLSDLQNVRTFVQTALLMSLEIVLVVGGYLILVSSRSPWLALLSIVPMPLWVWYILRFGKKVQPYAKASMEAGDKNTSILTENIAGVHVIKAFAAERQEIAKYDASCTDFYAKVMARIRLFVNFGPVMRIIASGSNLSLTLAVAIFVIKGKLNVGDFLILGTALGSILGRLQQVSAVNDQMQDALQSARRLQEILGASHTVPEKRDAQSLPPGTGAVTFDGVTFGYEAGKPVLRDMNFAVPGGSVVAIVGPTGAGKSTLVNLLARFYDPDAGRITIDGLDLRDASLHSLRTQVSFVFQETYLFSDTVEANIAYGRPNVTRGDVEAAARLAQAHEFIEKLPKQYDTVLAERGSSLSGGQKQRLAIARAILSNPRILVLDDATAAVDPETESLIRRAMKFVMFGRTTFVIAHRLSTVKAADMVLVIEHGQITQQGTHEQLMRQDGHYREIAQVQLHGDETVHRPSEDDPSAMHRIA